MHAGGCAREHDIIQELDLNLADAAFRRGLDLSGLKFTDSLYTTRIRTSEPIRASWSELGDKWAKREIEWASVDPTDRVPQVEEEFLFWKHNFDQLADKPAELEANYYLVKLDRELRFRPSDLHWWAAVVLQLPSRYGTRPFRPIWLSALLIAGFAVLFAIGNPFRKADDEQARLSGFDRLVFSLGYSLDIFLPLVKVSGVSDWGWDVGDRHRRWRWLTAVERVVGIALTAAAAYSVGAYLT